LVVIGEGGMENRGAIESMGAALYGFIGFAFGAAIGGIIGSVLGNALMCVVGFSAGFAVIGAVGGAALGLAHERAMLSRLALAGAIGFGVGHIVGHTIGSAIDSALGSLFGFCTGGTIGYAVEEAFLGVIRVGAAIAVGSAALGFVLGGRRRVLDLSLAGTVGAIIGIALGSLLGLTLEVIGGIIITFSCAGAALGLKLQVRQELPRLGLAGVVGFAVGFVAGGAIVRVGVVSCQLGVRLDILFALVGVGLSIAITRIRSR
jgi:hypothetical protein